MPFLENLAEGLSAAAGSQYGVDTIEKRKQRRQALSDMELQTQTQTILGDVQALQDRRTKLDPNSPTYQQDLSSIDQALHDARQVFTDLYHPENNPGALTKLHGFIQSHLGRHKDKQAGAATPAQAKQSIAERIAGVESAAYAPQSPNPYLTPDEQKHSARIKAGLEPSAGTLRDNPTKYQGQLTETTDADNKKHYWRVPLEAGGEPEEVDFKGQAVTPKPGAGGKPKKGWSKDENGPYSVLLDPMTNQPIPGTENHKDIPTGALVERITSGTYHFTDDKGNIHEVQEQHTSTPVLNAAPTQSIPKTPGEARSRVAPPPGKPVPGQPRDRILGHKDTAPQAKARTKFQEASGLSALADEIEKHPDDAVNQKRLAVRLERISAGRFTTQALDYIIRAGWGNSIQQWANNVTSGALPPDVMRQLIDGAHQEVIEAKEEMKTSGLDAGPDPMDELVKQLTNMVKTPDKTKPEKK